MPKKKPKKKAKPEKKATATPKSTPKLKAYLSKSELKQFRGMLLVRKAQLRGDVKALEAEGLGDGKGDRSGVPLHLADLGSDAIEQEMTLGLMESESDELQEIEDSLERIDDGSFGICENCDKPIPKMRLKAIPYTRMCIPCKEKEELA